MDASNIWRIEKFSYLCLMDVQKEIEILFRIADKRGQKNVEIYVDGLTEDDIKYLEQNFTVRFVSALEAKYEEKNGAYLKVSRK